MQFEVCGAYEQKSRDTGNNAAQQHRTYYYYFTVDSDISGGVFAFSDDGKFIAVFTESQIYVHQHGYNRPNYSFQYKFVSAHAAENAA